MVLPKLPHGSWHDDRIGKLEHNLIVYEYGHHVHLHNHNCGGSRRNKVLIIK